MDLNSCLLVRDSILKFVFHPLKTFAREIGYGVCEDDLSDLVAVLVLQVEEVLRSYRDRPWRQVKFILAIKDRLAFLI